MNPKALSTLEYPKIIEMLSTRAISPMGKAQAAALTPMTDIVEINRAQEETTAATGYILRKGSLPLGGIKDIRPFLTRALAGGMLFIEDLLGVSDFLYVCGKAMTYGRQERNIEPTSLTPYFDGILTSPSLEAEINRCIKSSTEIADNASPKLSDIRRSIRQAHDKVRDQLQSVIRSGAYKDMLQDSIITLRGDRFCVPVKADQRGNFPGMVHDQSSTGATVFMEPLAVVQLNNKIKELNFDEKREEERILMKLSGQVAGEADILGASINNLTYLDFVFAKGELALAQEATPPVFNDRGYINIAKGRHPLLKPDTVVPTNIWLGGEFSMLLITGPNTGGKTVALKTIGLLTCMGQAGLHIPAAEHSQLAVFDDVFADIGDEQSIEQSLSTFSSHMSNIVNILGQLDGGQALVLLDELGAGTDPTEGAALAIAILQYLQQSGARAAITTHYSELKLYALSTPGVENASCEFDVETLRPTYRLLIGVPGKSNAFAIAARLGLPEDIINQAKAVLSSEDVRFEDVITDLEAGKKMVAIEQERAAVYRREAEALRQDLARTQEKLQAQKDKIMEKAREDAMYTVQQARREAEALLKGMQQTKELEEARRQMRETLTVMETTIGPIKEKPAHKPPENLRRGDRVFIHSLNQHGTVSTPPNASGEVHIQAGIMKIKSNINDLSLAEEEEKQKFVPAGGESRRGGIGKAQHISSEIDLRGMLPEEATGVANKYLDDAFLGGLSSCTLIHGKGTGAVRNAVHAILKRHPHVKEYRLGKYGEGETGVTVVTLK